MLAWLRTRLYWIPLGFAILLGAVGWWTNQAVESAARAQLETKLRTILDANVAALEVWLASQTAVAQDTGDTQALATAVAALTTRFRASGLAALEEGPAAAEVARIVGGVAARHDYLAWRVYDAHGVCLAGSDPSALGEIRLRPAGDNERLAAGEVIVTEPISAEAPDLVSAPAGFIATLAGIVDADGELIGSVAFGIDAATTFSRPLEVARMGETGETYAFSSKGRLLSPSRFEPQLREIGLLPDDPTVGSFRNVEIRDPGGDLTEGFVAPLPVLARPLTRMAASAAAGESGIDLDGYRDYRGVTVVGAWRYLPELDLGLASEMDRREAYATLAPVRVRIGGLMLLLGVGALCMAIYSMAIRRMQGDLARARQLGRYRIDSVIGQGGMGTVYRASHALLRRPTAVKVLRPEHTTPESIARFEREVQVTSQLTHPNTIAVYDFGETPDGLFYYAMEYIEGATVREVVDRTAALPSARAHAILLAMSGSLAEAHRAGVIHRDIKPSNVMLCSRGGILDFVKVVDFGLVKPIGHHPELSLTDTRALTGTPLYMAPEVIRSAEAAGPASDVYQIGAVGWFMLTGRHVFEGANAVEVLDQHLNVEPKRPSAVLGAEIEPLLEDLMMRCLAKDPAERPADAGELSQALRGLDVKPPFGEAAVAAFWAEWAAATGSSGGVQETDSAPIAVGGSLDIGERLGEAARAPSP